MSDVRWLQRHQSFNKSLVGLQKIIELAKRRQLTDAEKLGLIKAFELSHELAWKTLKDFLETKGLSNIYGAKVATRTAFKAGLIVDGDVWMSMVSDRNLSVHTYNEKVANKIAQAIVNQYYQELQKLWTRLRQETTDGSE